MTFLEHSKMCGGASRARLGSIPSASLHSPGHRQCLTSCGDVNENSPLGLLCLNTWFWVLVLSEKVLGPLGCMVLLEEVHDWG